MLLDPARMKDTAAAPDRSAPRETPPCGMAPAPPGSPPTAKRWCRNSCRETGRAADIPRPECRAPTSRSPGTDRKCAIRPRSSGSARRGHSPGRRRIPLPVRSRAAAWDRTAPAPSAWRAIGRRGASPASRWRQSTRRARDRRPAATCSSGSSGLSGRNRLPTFVGVMDGGVEIGVVADLRRHEKLGVRQRQQMPAARFLVSCRLRHRREGKNAMRAAIATSDPDRASLACSATRIRRLAQRVPATLRAAPRGAHRRRPARNRRWPRRRAAGCRCLSGDKRRTANSARENRRRRDWRIRPSSLRQDRAFR